MKKLVLLLVILLSISSLVFAQAVSDMADISKSDDVLTVYAYDTFCGDWGAGNKVVAAFEEKTGIKVNLVSCGATVEMINKIRMEGDKCPADIILGVSDDVASKAYDLVMSDETSELANIPDELKFDPENRLIPFDYGAYAFVYDSESGIEEPKSLSDLTKDEYKGKVILIDPRTSSVGMGLLLWTYNALGEGYLDWWEKMKDNALTIASGWSSAYGLFTEGEAPIVISYTTSPVYHVMNEDTTRYQALIFSDGHEATIESVGILKNAKHSDQAKAFIDFLLTDGQLETAIANSMYPANTSLELPSAFDYAQKPAKIFKSGQVSEEKTKELLEKWTEVMTK